MSSVNQNTSSGQPSLAVTQIAEGLNVPLSFKEWIDFYKGIIPGDEFKQYNNYLTQWYKDSSIRVTNRLTDLQINYLFLFKQLQVFFQKQDLENWYANIDLTSEKEILLAIPYFAKKLKEISLYYLKLRTEIKDNQIRYKLVGTPDSVSQEVQNYLLTNYTKKPDFIQTIPAAVWQNVPELSSILEPINVEIEELYDTFNYMDHSNTLPASAYYDFNDQNTNNFFKTLGLNLPEDSWVFTAGAFSNILSSQIVDNIDLNEQILQKYLGTDKYTITPVTTSSNAQIFSLPVVQGNNLFYWPIGAYKTFLKELPFFDPQPLSGVGIENIATAGETIETADTIFLKTVDGIEGAWLRQEPFIENTAVMKSVLRKLSKTQFRFPYPGYGLSGEDISWTGYGLESDRRFYFLDDPYKNAIYRQYWSSNLELTGTKPISINSTTLVDNGAYANEAYSPADKIRIWPESTPYTNSSYRGVIDEAWLYRMNGTEISIAPATDSVVIWPFEKITSENQYPSYIPDNLNAFCLPTSLTDIKLPFGIASNNLSGADSIYFIQNYQDKKENAAASAWLSGRDVYYPETKLQTVLQPGLVIEAIPGTFTKFIWQGEDNIECNLVFKSYNHQPNCKYITENGTYKNINLCTCKLPLFTPFGHPGEKYNKNQRLADFIIEDITPNASLDLTTWIDRNNKRYNESDAFGWFKTNQAIGWGSGQWVNNNNESFVLKKGHSYIYYRAQSRDLDSTVTPFSAYALRFSYNNFTPENFAWIQSKKDSNNNWVDTTAQTSIVIEPGDNFIYTRQPTTNFALTGTITQDQTIAENKGSIWTDLDYVTVGQNVVLSYPLQTILSPQTPSSQYPDTNLSEFFKVFMWSISSQANNSIKYYPKKPSTRSVNSPIVSFTPTTTGLYSFSVTAITAETIPPETFLSGNTFYYLNTGFYTFNNIPHLTALPTQIEVPSLTSFTTPAPGFILSTPLFGWNYNTNSPTENIQNSNQGARPIWVKPTPTTTETAGNFFRIDTLGSSIRLLDKYNLISQPEPSDLQLTTGMFVEYERNSDTDILWTQSIVQQISATKNTWCKIIYSDNNNYNLSNIVKSDTLHKMVIPTTSSSPLLLQTYVNNEPVEIYYNARNSFIWSISAQPTVLKTFYSDISTTATIDVAVPSENLSNRYYPTVAILPTLQSLSSHSDIGGYFVPSNLGVLQYLNRNYTTIANTSAIDYKKVYENPNEYISGIGNTKQEQQTFYRIKDEDNSWLKEPPITGTIAGTIKKDVFKKYPKFIPYQSISETNKEQKLGLITQDSLLTPWTGPQDTDWGDSNNKPISFTGQINVNKWGETQILKQTDLQLENWCTDIYNNQYGLYKPTKEVINFEKKTIPGELWVRKNSQKIYPAAIGLSSVLDTYQNITLINDLTGRGILNIETFFDTLYIQTSSAVIFEKVIYDYATDNIFSLIDDARYLSLALPIQTNLDREFSLSSFETTCTCINDHIYAKTGETWFFPKQKQIVQSICSLSGNYLLPELYSYEQDSLEIKKIFPLKAEDITLIAELSNLKLSNIDSPLLTYNSNIRQFLFTVNTQNISGENIHIDFKIKNSVNELYIDDINVYIPNKANILEDPPVLTQNLHLVLQTPVPFVLQLSPLHGPVTYTTINWPDWVEITENGLIQGQPESNAGFYSLPFYVTNIIGSTYYCFTLQINEVINVESYILGAETTTDYFSISSLTTDISGVAGNTVSWIATN